MGQGIKKAYENAKKIQIDENSKLVLFSDLHRGSGGGGDAFAKNKDLFFAALQYYLKEGYTYIELGDGDELWKENNMGDIIGEYEHIFQLLERFYRGRRFVMLAGNHDSIKGNRQWVFSHLQSYQPRHGEKSLALFPRIVIVDAVRLLYKNSGRELLLLHGHQGDFRSSHFMRLTKLCVRYLWQPFEFLGLQNPFDAKPSYRRQSKVERNLTEYARGKSLPIIAGHTHRPKFPQKGEVPYFNTGSGVHTRYITGIELTKGEMVQIRWVQGVSQWGNLYVKREELSQKRKIEEL